MSSFVANSPTAGASEYCEIPDTGPMIHIDPDTLWRCFVLYNIKAGNPHPFNMNLYNFLQLMRNSQLPRRPALSDGQMGVIFRACAMPNTPEKSMRSRIFESSQNRHKERFERHKKHGHKLNYSSFLQALMECATRINRRAGSPTQAMLWLVHNHVLRNSYPRVSELPFGVSVDDAKSFLADAQVVAFMGRYKDTLDHIFTYCRPATSQLEHSTQVRWMSFSEYMKFVDEHLWFSRSNPNILSKAQVAQIFAHVKTGGGTGHHSDMIDDIEFHTALVLLALAGTKSCQVTGPVVHTIAESKSSASLRYDHTKFNQSITPVDKIKWLFRRMHNSPVARESKARWLLEFRHKFASDLKRDGAPQSYLLPYIRAPIVPVATRRRLSGAASNGQTSPRRRLSIQSPISRWTLLQDPNGREYYFNEDTNEIRRQLPESMDHANAGVQPVVSAPGGSSNRPQDPSQIDPAGVMLTSLMEKLTQ